MPVKPAKKRPPPLPRVTPEHKTRAAAQQRAALKPHTESYAYSNRDGRRK